MAPQTLQVLQPQYVNEFSCCGSACEDTCCSNWRIAVDKKTYQLYQKCPDVTVRSKLKTHVKRTRMYGNDINYARIELTSKYSCPFLDEELLCSLQRKFGEKYLSVVCSAYPRVTNNVDSVIERSLNLSCPEAARAALLKPQIMEFDLMEEKQDIRRAPGLVIHTKQKNKINQFFWEIRTFIISLLQNRQYPLWQRLVILGLACSRISELQSAGNLHEIPETIEIYKSRISNGDYSQHLNVIQNNFVIQIELINILMNPQTFLEGTHQRFLRFQECFQEYYQGIVIDYQANEEEIIKRYSNAFANYYQPLMEQYEHILEHYLVNYVFRTLFPFGDGKSVFEHYVMMIIDLSLLKTLLIGMSSFHREQFSVEHVIKAIQTFSKVVEHNDTYLVDALDFIVENNMASMPYMAALIKN